MKIRILKIEDQNEAARQIKKVGAYSKSIPLMSPKVIIRTIKIKDIDAVACNILKQEMLSLGGDVAVSKEAITKSSKRSDCLIFGTLSQLKKLYLKLKKQPLGLDKISFSLKEVIDGYQKDNFRLSAGSFSLQLGKKTRIMAILNVTPDSFSDGNRFYNKDRAIEHAFRMAKEGADIIDVGGESTRPGAKRINSKEQMRRVLPLIRKLSKGLKIPISIDTRNYEVAKAAIDNGASIVNDISGLKDDKRIAKLVAKSKAGLILMHIKGKPQTMQKNPQYKCLIQEIINSLDKSIQNALSAGIKARQIVIDPGIGFGKTTEHNLVILRHLSEFKSLGYPIMVGTSRKSLIGNILNLPVDERLMGTAATVVYSILEGVHILRIHDVKMIKQVIDMTEAIKKARLN